MGELHLQFVEERIAELAGQRKASLWDRFWGRKPSALIYIAPRLPKYDYLRLEQFLEDLAVQIGDDEGFPISSLVSLLVLDFIQAPCTKASCKKWLGLKEQFFADQAPVMEWVEIAEGHLVLRQQKKKVSAFRIPLEFPRRTAIQAELAIVDYHAFDPHFDLSLEDLISLLLLAFLDSLKSGKQKSVLKELLKRSVDM